MYMFAMTLCILIEAYNCLLLFNKYISSIGLEMFFIYDYYIENSMVQKCTQ